MSDKKISQLPASTTPLAGTEELAIVQSGDTKKVSAANLTAGRATSVSTLTSTSGLIEMNNAGNQDFRFALPGVIDWRFRANYASGNLEFNQIGGLGNVGGFTLGGNFYTYGNVIIGTSGKGINTSAAHPVTFAINSSEAARIHASKGVSIGNTVDPGVNNLSVTGGITNANIKTGNGLLTNNLSAPEIMFSAAGQGIYIVFAYIEAYDPNDWSAQATVTSSGGGALKLTAVNNAGMEITVSGTDVLCQQIGGGGSPLGTKYVYQKII